MKNKLILSLLFTGSLGLNVLALELTPLQIQEAQDLIASNPSKYKNLKIDLDSYNSMLPNRGRMLSPVLKQAYEKLISAKANLVLNAMSKVA